MGKHNHRIPTPSDEVKTSIPQNITPHKKTVGKVIANNPKRFVFSFRYWKQIEYFGLDKVKLTWFVSLLDKLTELSEEPLDAFRKDYQKKNANRYHSINWGQRNIPIKRNELDWLPPDYRDNEKEYIFYQIMITKGLGRIAGFWDENDIFYIILLDPFHNFQPTRDTNYRVDRCSPLNNMYSSLLDDVRQTKQSFSCTQSSCSLQNLLNSMPLRMRPRFNAVLFHLNDDQLRKMEELLDTGKCKTLDEILIAGIDYISA